MDDLARLGASELSALIHARKASCREVMRACLDRVARINPAFNALVSLQDPDELMREAGERDAMLARGESMGRLHGIPQAIKDMCATAGIRTTLGSPLFADNVPAADDLMVARMKRAGAIVIGKTNTPEFGLGSQTYNTVFGATRNAWDRSKCAGGSSGGAAVALAQGLLSVADGSDMMGSLRNPAGFNNVFGMRPSQGRAPSGPGPDAYVAQLGTVGPMGRSVRDVAMLLSVQAGYDERAPLSLDGDGTQFATPLDANVAGTRIGWLGSLDGYLEIEPGILDACESGLARLSGLGCDVITARAGFSPASTWETWLTWRRWLVAGDLAGFHADPAKRALLKPEAQWEASQGAGLSGQQVFEASVARTAFTRQMVAMFERHDVLALPTAQVWPFDVETHWPAAINGRAMDTYHRWMEVVIYATLAGLPAMSVPVGFGPGGLPMGMQLIGRPRGDLALLQLASAYEQAAGDLLARRPDID